ncbi:hypothetical protein TNCV_2032541 [Trichonephila clavipes]|nr:hypothetical protein TNCV_2032541 [Trichonephila clavipes]
MGIPLYTRNDTAVEAVDGSRWLIAEESDRINRKNLFPGRKGIHVYDFPNIFRGVKGILLMDNHERGRTIAGEYYSNVLDQLDAKINEKKMFEEEKIILSG